MPVSSFTLKLSLKRFIALYGSTFFQVIGNNAFIAVNNYNLQTLKV